ncbi:hypothetical protein F5888DRAFT_321829 [Russula emetica]|nr:hypothetical protein F5888DRAFT_321829 [Russula emetica]
MKFSLTLAAALFLPVLVNAQSNVTVQVGAGGQLVYNPSNFTASNGTRVTFIFPSYELHLYYLFAMLMHALCRGSLAHSVTQGSFANPCVYLNGTGGTAAGFDSGLQTEKQFTISITNDQERRQRHLVISFPCGLTTFARQPSSGSAKIRATVALEWLGKFSFRIVTLSFSQRHISMMFFRSAINPPSSGNTFEAYMAAAKALGSNEPAVGCFLDPQGFHLLTHSLDDFQISDSGPVTGGVGAVATATPAPTSAGSSSATASESSPTSTPYSSAGHVVADGLVALLAVALGITLA